MNVHSWAKRGTSLLTRRLQPLTIYIYCSNQSHYREVPRCESFMEQELRFGLDLGRFALLIMSNFSGQFFHVFMGIFFLHCSARTKKLLHKKVKSFLKKLGRIFFGSKIGYHPTIETLLHSQTNQPEPKF